MAEGRASADLLENLAGVEGLEPPTLGLEIRCSILLSYTPEIRTTSYNDLLDIGQMT